VRRIIVRTLSRELHLHVDGDEAFAALSYLGADPQMPGMALQRVDLPVEKSGPFFRVAPPGRATIEGSLDIVVHRLFGLLAVWLAEDTADAPILHAAVATIDGRRCAFLGDKGAGKTTLMLSLIEQGIDVEGDEHVVIRSGGGLVRPRRLHVKEGSVALFPGLAEAILASPASADWMGAGVYACRPSLGGAPWVIEERPIDCLVFVESNFGGSSILSPLPREEAFARLMEAAFMPATGRGAAAARLRRLCVEATPLKFQVGNLAEAVRRLQAIARFGSA